MVYNSYPVDKGWEAPNHAPQPAKESDPMVIKASSVLVPFVLVLGACSNSQQLPATPETVDVEASALGFGLIMPKDPVELKVVVQSGPANPSGPVAAPSEPGTPAPGGPSVPAPDLSVLNISIKRENLFLGRTFKYSGAVNVVLTLPAGITTENGETKFAISASSDAVSIKLKAKNSVKPGIYQGKVSANGNAFVGSDKGTFKISVIGVSMPAPQGPIAEQPGK